LSGGVLVFAAVFELDERTNFRKKTKMGSDSNNMRAGIARAQSVVSTHGLSDDWVCHRLITPMAWLLKHVRPNGHAMHDKHYIAKIKAGEPLEPVKLNCAGSIVTIQDGHHRIGAAMECGLVEIEAIWRLKRTQAPEAWITARLADGFRRV
jgi:hypothetical protein